MTSAVEYLPGHGEHEEGDPPPAPFARDGSLLIRNVAGIVPEAVNWLWRDRIPVGVVSALAGDGGLGKSTLTMLIAAQVTRGEIVGKTGTKRVGILLCEDSPAAVIRPRLAAAGAVLENVDVLSVTRDGIDAPLSLPDDLGMLRGYVEEHRPELLIADPVMGLLSGGVDSHRDGGKGGIRAVLGPLHRIAEDTGTTIIAVFHLNKSGGPSGQRIGGSAAIRNAVRNVLMLAPHPDSRTDGDDDGRRVIGHEKSNYGETQRTLEAVVESAPVCGPTGAPLLRDDGTAVTTARMVLGEESDVDYRQALASASSEDKADGGDPDALGEAIGFLRDELANGPVPSRKLDACAADAGIAKRTLVRARKELGVKSAKGANGWTVSLPGILGTLEENPVDTGDLAVKDAKNANGALAPEVGTLGTLESADAEWEAAL